MRPYLLAALHAALLLAPGRAFAQSGPPAPTGPPEPGFQAVADMSRAASARIRPGDRVIVRVWREPDLSEGGALVNERSEVVLPRLGLVPVGEQSLATLRDWLRGEYAKFLREPVVEVTVLRRVVVNGEVNRPGIYHVDITTGLRDVIAQAGGIGPGGTWGKVTIVRGEQRIPIRNWIQADSAAADLHSGDQVVVGRKNWFAQNALAVTGTALAVASFVISLRRQ